MKLEKALKYRGEYYFDKSAARRALNFFQNELQHSEGSEFDGKRFILQPWQRRLVRRVFGWKRRKDGTRKFRKVFLFVPTGNGKSFIVSGFGGYLFAADKEPGSIVVACAADTIQAEIIFNYAKTSFIRNPKLKTLIGEPYKRSMVIKKTMSSFKVISSNANTKYGYSIQGVLIDELHAQKKRELVEALQTRTRTRRQPITLYATTAGFDKRSICGDLYEYFKKVKDGIIDDPEAYPVIYEADPDDDFRDPKVWAKANPNFGITVKEDFIASQCKMAQEMPAFENTFKRQHLNIWTAQDSVWIPMDKWDLCNGTFNLETLRGKKCYGGLDLADTDDVSAFVLVFPMDNGDVVVLPKFWVPGDTTLERQRKGKGDYFDWVRGGEMLSTPGNIIDYDFIKRDILEMVKLYNVVEVGFDPWNATQLSHQLNDTHGVKMIPFRQGYGSLSAPSKMLETLWLKKKLRHGGHRVLRWMASNVTVEQDAAGNIKPSKGKSSEKIDGIVGLVMAIGRMMVHTDRRSVYEDRGIRSLG